MGRFVTEDSYIGDPNNPTTLNRYTYAGNNPVKYIDPSGHSYEEFLNVIGIIGYVKDFGSQFFNFVQGKGFKTNSQLNIEQREKLAKQADGDKTVANAQASLALAGYDLGRYGLDGYQGKDTTAALTEFQKDIGLNPTGKLDPQTMIALNMVTASGLQKDQVKKISKALSNLDGQNETSKSNNPKWLEVAKQQLGKPYVMDFANNKFANPPDSFDCSSYVQWVYKYGFGVNLPRTVSEIYKVTIEVNKPALGNMIVFHSTYDANWDGVKDVNDKSHIGIWLGNNQFIHASSSRGVTINNLDDFNGYYINHFDSYRVYPGIMY